MTARKPPMELLPRVMSPPWLLAMSRAMAREGRKPGPEPKADAERIKAMRKSGKMIREIMTQTGLSKATIYRALDR